MGVETDLSNDTDLKTKGDTEPSREENGERLTELLEAVLTAPENTRITDLSRDPIDTALLQFTVRYWFEFARMANPRAAVPEHPDLTMTTGELRQTLQAYLPYMQ